MGDAFATQVLDDVFELHRRGFYQQYGQVGYVYGVHGIGAWVEGAGDLKRLIKRKNKTASKKIVTLAGFLKDRTTKKPFKNAASALNCFEKARKTLMYSVYTKDVIALRFGVAAAYANPSRRVALFTWLAIFKQLLRPKIDCNYR